MEHPYGMSPLPSTCIGRHATMFRNKISGQGPPPLENMHVKVEKGSVRFQRIGLNEPSVLRVADGRKTTCLDLWQNAAEKRRI